MACTCPARDARVQADGQSFWCDNNSAILNLGKPPEDWTRVHLNTKYFRCCQWCLEKTFLHEHIEGRLNPADIFTKGLPADVFSNLRDVLIQSLLLSFLATFLAASKLWREFLLILGRY